MYFHLIMAAMGKLGIGNQDHTVLATGVEGRSWGVEYNSRSALSATER